MTENYCFYLDKLVCFPGAMFLCHFFLLFWPVLVVLVHLAWLSFNCGINDSIKRKNKDSEGEEKENIESLNNNTDNSTQINEDSIEAEKDLPYSEQDEFIPDHMTLEERKRFQFLRYESVRANCFVHYEGYSYDLNKIQFEKGKK